MTAKPMTGGPIGTAELTGILGHWAQGKEPLYEQLADALRSAITEGALTRGTVLPPQRVLATTLRVSRTTVIAAIDRLRGEGWLQSAQGSGTWVAGRAADVDTTLPDHQVASYRVRRLEREAAPKFQRTVLDLGTAMFDDSLGLEHPYASASREDHGALNDVGGFAPIGTPELRSELAEMLTCRGLPTEIDQICVTTGGQQALWLLACLYAGQGGPFVVEDPAWSAGLDAIRAAGGQIMTIPVDAYGAVVPALEELVRRTRPALVVLVPEFHNPTGARMHEVRRAAAARLSAEYQIPVAEDFVLWGLSVARAGGRFESLARFNPEAQIITFGSMTKLFWRGLRVGWIRAPQVVIRRLAKLKAAVDAGTPVISQLAAARALRDLEAVRTERARQVERAATLVHEWAAAHELPWHLPRPEGGLSAWARLPVGSATEFSQVALRYGVEVWPGPVFSHSESFDDHLRLPLGRPLAYLTEGLERLGEAWADYASGAHQRPRPSSAADARSGLS
jgi:DNA-binding transcriptional MocR family regulator